MKWYYLNMNKKIFVVLLIILTGVFVFGLWLNFRGNQTPTQPFSSTIPSVSEKDWSVLYQDPRYQIVYVMRLGAHRMVFPTDPTPALQNEAENKLLEVLKLTQTTVCKLKVYISLYSAESIGLVRDLRPLSFCLYPSPSIFPSPSLILDPNLGKLNVKSVSPQSGTVPMGNTNNGIIIVFDRPVDPTTVYTTSSPPTKLTPIIRKDDLSRLILAPDINWDVGATYTIKVSAGLVSVDGKFQTKEDIFLSYTTTEPSPPVFTSEEP